MLAQEPLVGPLIRHGHYYTQGCRCQPCVEGHDRRVAVAEEHRSHDAERREKARLKAERLMEGVRSTWPDEFAIVEAALPDGWVVRPLLKTGATWTASAVPVSPEACQHFHRVTGVNRGLMRAATMQGQGDDAGAALLDLADLLEHNLDPRLRVRRARP